MILARDENYAQSKLDIVTRVVSNWMKDKGLELITHKTELVFLTRKQMQTFNNIVNVGTEKIETKEAIRYRDVTLDSKMTFVPRISKPQTRQQRQQ